MTDTKKAFRKLSKTNDVQAAANILCNMKGVSPGMASGKLLDQNTPKAAAATKVKETKQKHRKIRLAQSVLPLP